MTELVRFRSQWEQDSFKNEVWLEMWETRDYFQGSIVIVLKKKVSSEKYKSEGFRSFSKVFQTLKSPYSFKFQTL